MDTFIGLKELRQNMAKYARRIERGENVIVMKHNKPLFKISPVSDEENRWEEVIDFTTIKKGGVSIEEILKRL